MFLADPDVKGVFYDGNGVSYFVSRYYAKKYAGPDRVIVRDGNFFRILSPDEFVAWRKR